jgi:hypothetical protein
VNGTILANSSAIDRSKTDFYPTPDNVTIALMNYLNLPGGSIIWEPACGEGHISRAIVKLGYTVVSSELYNREYGMIGIDFLETTKGDSYRSDCNWIITNPPFSLSEEFIRKCINHGLPFALLLKSQYWHSSRRRKLFEEYKPAAVLPLTWRPDFLFGAKSGSPTMECIWTVWENKPAEYTIYQPLIKPNIEGA